MKYIELTQGKRAIVDDEFFEELSKHKWHAIRAKKTFYAVRNYRIPGVGQRFKWMHREILNLAGIPAKRATDHRDRDGLNNLLENIRPATTSQNCCNRGPNSNGRSGYKGVSWKIPNERWMAYITVNGKRKHIGLYDTAEEAALAFDAAAKELHGEFAYQNFSQGCDEAGTKEPTG